MDISQVSQGPRTQWAQRCHAVEEMLRSGRRRDAAPVSPFEGPADQMGLALETHLLCMAQELAEAVLALRPSSDDEGGPDIWTAYDRLHRAKNDVAALYHSDARTAA
jgi:hypothetical protein